MRTPRLIHEGFSIPVHDNDENPITLLTKRSQGQYRRYARERSIAAKQDKALNKKEDMPFHEEERGGNLRMSCVPLNRAQEITRIVEAELGNPNIRHIIQRLSSVFFRVTIQEHPLRGWAIIDAKDAARNNYVPHPDTHITLRVYPRHYAIYFYNWYGIRERLETGFSAILHAIPTDYRIIPNYNIRNANLGSVLLKIVREIRPDSLMLQASARVLLSTIEREEHQGHQIDRSPIPQDIQTRFIPPEEQNILSSNIGQHVSFHIETEGEKNRRIPTQLSSPPQGPDRRSNNSLQAILLEVAKQAILLEVANLLHQNPRDDQSIQILRTYLIQNPRLDRQQTITMLGDIYAARYRIHARTLYNLLKDVEDRLRKMGGR